MEGYASIRLIPVPTTVDKPRPCDVQVSSDDGKTWATLLTTETAWVGDTITISFPVKLNNLA